MRYDTYNNTYRATVTIVQFQVVVAALLLPQFFFINNQYQLWTTPHKSVGELTATKQKRTNVHIQTLYSYLGDTQTTLIRPKNKDNIIINKYKTNRKNKEYISKQQTSIKHKKTRTNTNDPYTEKNTAIRPKQTKQKNC